MTPLASLYPRRSLKRRLLAGGVVVFGTRAVGALGLLFVSGMLARLLPLEAMGQYVLLQSIVIVAALLVGLGLPQLSVRILASYRGSGAFDEIPAAVRCLLGTAGWSVAFCSVVGIAVVLLFDEAFSMNSIGSFGVILLVVWTASLVLYTITASIFRGLEYMLLAGLCGGVIANVFLGSALVLMWEASADLSLLQAVALTSAAALLNAALGMAWLANIIGRPVVSVRPHGPGDILRQSLPMMIANSSVQSARQVTLWAVALFGVAAEVAVYGLAVRFYQGLSMLLVVSNLLGAPFVAELHAASDRHRMAGVARALATVSAFPIVIMLLAIVAFGEHAMALVFGEFYRGAASVAIILGVGHAVQALLGLNTMLLMMTGHERILVMVQALGAGATVVVAVLGYRLGGLNGVAAGVSSVSIVQHMVLAMLVRRHLGFWAFATFDPRPILATIRRRFA